ncbi:hypothetical protein [Synechococcus sp. WH 8016]|uniref:hypothetical protein n=1 Tax=Synechococcus sp. WH 8016 TaxID=166318 RepID=UPI00022D9E77|nr:hypothetical protein [Synechococcus sp. WH 8016]EHA64329.1 hypothetical protein Syn8016DRAFT_1372 [Synechococcus sp. WH 8016]
MSVSSFQPLNPRQLDLQRRLLVANELREASLIAQLELQWVHRYGVTSLPKRSDEASLEALPSAQSPEVEVEEEPKIQGLSLVSDQTVETETPALHVAPLPSPSQADEAEGMEDLADRSSNPPLAIAPPPFARGAQRFRRWMVASSAVQDLQAS